MILIFQSSFRLSEKNEKDKKRKELTPVSATPTHMLRICVNPSFNTFRRLAATGANKVPRPSRYSIAMATGSKRSSADSDSLLCHVRLWRTSRFRFGCMSGCEHSEINVILIVPSAHILDSRPPTLLCGRADNACTNLLGSLVRYVRTRGMYEIAGRG